MRRSALGLKQDPLRSTRYAVRDLDTGPDLKKIDLLSGQLREGRADKSEDAVRNRFQLSIDVVLVIQLRHGPGRRFRTARGNHVFHP